jgi:hypothetical protein
MVPNLKVQFGPCVFFWIWKWCPKKGEDHLIFTNSAVKKFIIQMTPKKENFDVWILQSCGFHRTRDFNFRKLIYRKVVEDPIVISSSIYSLIFWENDLSNYVKNYTILPKKHKGFLEVKYKFYINTLLHILLK